MAQGFSQHHIKARDEDIARYCFIPGSHTRGRKMAEKADRMRLVADAGILRIYRDVQRDPMTVCSTGMGVRRQPLP